MNTGWHIRWSILGALWLGACSDSLTSGDAASSPGGADQFGTGGGFGAGEGSGGATGAGGGSNGGTTSLPPEQELSVDFERPHAGERFVYVPNPDRNSVAVIDSTKLTIQTVEAGAEPRFLQTLAGKDAAIVLNVASFDATVIRTAEDGTSTTVTVEVQRGANAIAIAPDGEHAVVYYDSTFTAGSVQPDSFQDVSVLTLTAGKERATGMTVGFRPSRVFFSADGATAFVVTKDGVSILDFADIEAKGTGIAATVPLGSTSAEEGLDVSVTRDGKYALARLATGSTLRLVDLVTGEARELDLATLEERPPGDAGVPQTDSGAPQADSGAPQADSGAPQADSGAPQADSGAPQADSGAPQADSGAPRTDSGALQADSGVATASDPPAPASSSPPAPSPAPALGPATVTDVDLSEAGDYAVAVLRERSTVVRLPIPGGFTDPTTATVTSVPGELIGSVTLTPGGKYALLYTTVVDTNERLTVLPLSAGGKPTSYQLRKSVASVAVAPDDGTALVVHRALPGDPLEAGLDPEVKLDRQNGYSLVALDTGFAKLQVTQAPLGPSAIVPDGSQLFVLFGSAGLREVQKADLRSFLVSAIQLGSPPISVGAIPGSQRVFVGQDHPDGRISFIDWTTGAVQSVTGFELNGKIRE